jgi:Protein of unknown function (DUF3429)
MLEEDAMPALAILLGVAGAVPFVVCGLGALSQDTATAARMLAVLVAYGAVILSFLGGIHWGFALAPDVPRGRRQAWQLGLGTLPALLGWAALELGNWIGPAVLIAGFIATAATEHRAARSGLRLPSGYIWLRWGLTIVAVAMLTTVLTLRLFGLTRIF